MIKHLNKSHTRYLIVTPDDDDRPWWRACSVSYHDNNSGRYDGRVAWNLLPPRRYWFALGALFGRNGGESDVGLALYFGPVGTLWLRLRAPWLAWLRVRGRERKDWFEARHTGFRLGWAGTIISVEIDNPENMYSRRLGAKPKSSHDVGPRWIGEWSLSPYQIVGRKGHYTTPVLEQGSCVIPTPEGAYPATWALTETSTSYVRWPGTWIDALRGKQTRRSYQIDIPGGIPFWGKGENSWDCGMTGLLGVGSDASLEDAAGKAVLRVLQSRKKNGGPHRLPHPMTVSEAADWVVQQQPEEESR